MVETSPRPAMGFGAALLFVSGHVLAVLLLAGVWGWWAHVHTPAHQPGNFPFVNTTPLDLTDPARNLSRRIELRPNPLYRRPMTAEELGAWAAHGGLLYGGLIALLRLASRPGKGALGGAFVAAYFASWALFTFSGVAPNGGTRAMASLGLALAALLALVCVRWLRPPR